MENYQIIIYAVSFIIISFLGIGLVRKTNEAKNLKEQLKIIRGQSDDELFGRGKFTELGLMSAGITHEISNPLTVILGHVTRLSRMDLNDKNKPDIKKSLDQIKKNAERISSIIQSVREYIYRNDEETEEYISLTEIIHAVLVFYGQRLKNHGIEFRLKNVDKIYISGHKGQFEQALLNLISNAFDAVDNLDEKWIEVSAIKTNDNVQIYVRDSGQGIPSEIQSKMLNPFYTTKKNKGSGLGLSLVKAIAQKHGGDLKFVEDEHTTFMLELPQASSYQYHH
ncbi:MAG: HAMP domain-containing histidine kinase [Bacteriovoracaceae bacterium]|nr:HAMP domain-containing histidine kinase [Bacteriovoracaceae bacterium]